MIIMATSSERITFDKDEVKDLMKRYNKRTPEKALEEWAYWQYDLKHNASVYIKRVGKTFVDIAETP